MADDDDHAATSSDDQTAPTYPSKSSSSTFTTSGKDKKSTSKPLPPPSSKLKGVVDDDDEGGFSPPSSPQPEGFLYGLTNNCKWDEASTRCGTHPQDASWKDDDGFGGLPIHWACYNGAPLSLIRQLHEAYGDGVRTTDNGGWLPLHHACRWSASLEVITYLHEAYGEGIRTTDKGGRLPLHYACFFSSLEVITYLHGQYPDGATKKNKNGKTTADYLDGNRKLAEEDKAKARDILFGPPRAPTTSPRPTKPIHAGAKTATSADVSTSTATPSPSKAATLTSGGITHHHGTTTSTQPLTMLHGVDQSVAGSKGGYDGFDEYERTTATTAVDTPISSQAPAKMNVAGSAEEATTTTMRENEVSEQVETADEEARYAAVSETVVRAAGGAPSEAVTTHMATAEEAEGFQGETGAVREDARRRHETEAEREADEGEAGGRGVLRRGDDGVGSFSAKDRSKCLGDDGALKETAFRLAAERLEAKGFYELHRPAKYDESDVPSTATQLLSSEHSFQHCHRWEVHCLYDTLLIPSSESETVRDLKDVGYIMVAHKDGSSTESTGGETDSSGGSGGGKKDSRGDSSGGSRWTRRVRGAFRGLGIGGDKQDKENLLVVRYNFPHRGPSSNTIFVRNERTDHGGKDVMMVKDIDLQTTTVGDLKREIRLEWHRGATDLDLCLFREDGTELRFGDRTLRDCYVVAGDMILLRQPRVVGKLHVGEQSALKEWRHKTSPGRTNRLALHVLKCEGQKDGQNYLVDPTCAENFRPHLSISFLPFYTPSNENESQSRLEIKVCTLEFGVKQDEGDGDGMISQSRHRGFFVDKFRLAFKLRGDVRPTRISCPVYTVAPKTYGSRRSRGVAMTARSGERLSLDVNGRHLRESSEAITETPVHWRIGGDKTPHAWDFSRQTWNAPEEHGGYTMYDVMDPRDIRDFKSKKYSGHNQWLEKTEIPDVTTTYADPIGENDKFLTATWMMDDFQDPFHDPDDEHIAINDRQARATFTVILIMGLCEIKIMTLPGRLRCSYQVVKRYREVAIIQEVQFAKISSAPKNSSPRSIITGTAYAFDATTTPAARTLMDKIRSRRWQEVATILLRIDSSECERLFFFACRWGPSTVAVQGFLQVDDTLPRKSNLNQELPIHILCRFGAEKGAIEALVGNYPQSITAQSGISNNTPLGFAQSGEWIYYKDDQADVISFLRQKSCAEHFDGMTGLPLTSGFDLWAHIKPPGLTDANVVLLYIDMAGFTAVNNNVGHKEEGDRILKKCARDISRLCEVHADLMRSGFRVPHEVYRMGGDEFAVVLKFSDNPWTVWENFLENLATSLSELNYVDEQESPPRYSTFLRIGCAAGRLSKINNVLSKADKTQTELKKMIGLEKGACVALSELRRQGKKNVSDLCVL